ncbi:hypothetical protein DL771_007005 [Monosporascus sp. 5C6A]|nr:hypothetical protein DL771_007005 [Monosporascus sp. 5C6A]
MDWSRLPCPRLRLDNVSVPGYIQSAVFLLAFYWAVSFLFENKQRVPNAPVHGFRGIFEPSLLLQARFITGGHKIIASGYQKVMFSAAYLPSPHIGLPDSQQFKDKPFVVRRWDIDITVLPMKYLNEVRMFPPSKMNGRHAHINNLVPKWTGTQFMMEGDLHFRVASNKLNPELYKYVDKARVEFEHGWQLEVPKCEEWTEVDIQTLIRTLVARMSARIFLGYPTCRNPDWLKLSVDYSIDTFITSFTLRMFPPWAHPIIAHLIPARYRMKSHLRTGRTIIEPLVEKHAYTLKSQPNGMEPDDDYLLNWMLDNATEKEKALPEMEEIDEVYTALGQIGDDPNISSKEWLSRLEKLDSCFIESQRVNPVILLSPQRVAIESITLKDGLHIPAGARVGFPHHQYQMDPSVTPDPDKFDPLRSYRKRRASPDMINKFQAVQLDLSNLTFGYGSQACPGRFFAVTEIKMILARLLHEYDIQFPPMKARPQTLHPDENVFLDPNAKLMMRKRSLH